MKKFSCFIMICIVIFLCSACNFSLGKAGVSNEEDENSFWLKDESYLIDYTIKGDRIQLRYSFCFYNNSGYDLRMNGFILDLKRRDLKGWLKYEDNYEGELENGVKEVLIPFGEKMNVVLVIEGEYLGGEVNTEFRINHVVMGQRVEQ